MLALQAGLDPIRYLDMTGAELMLAQEIIKQAGERKAEDEKRYWKNMAASVANGIAMAFK